MQLQYSHLSPATLVNHHIIDKHSPVKTMGTSPGLGRPEAGTTGAPGGGGAEEPGSGYGLHNQTYSDIVKILLLQKQTPGGKHIPGVKIVVDDISSLNPTAVDKPAVMAYNQ
jgi:hypothetical protein